MTKEQIYLKDITLHVRDLRQTISFSQAAEKGRMYQALPPDYASRLASNDPQVKIGIELPEDLKERQKRGEVDIFFPTDGLQVHFGKDVWGFVKKIQNKVRNELIHRNRDNIWRDDKKGV